MESEKPIKYLVVDTSAFIQNEQLLHHAENVYTVREVVDEIKNKRQLKRLCVLPYELVLKDVFPENVQEITAFAKKTGDYLALSATDLMVLALTYQLEKEHVGADHIRTTPTVAKTISSGVKPDTIATDLNSFAGFYFPGKTRASTDDSDEVASNESCDDGSKTGATTCEEDTLEDLHAKFRSLNCEDLGELAEVEGVLVPVKESNDACEQSDDDDSEHNEEGDDNEGWITPANIYKVKKQANSELIGEKRVKVACMTTDFAMQNVLKQMNLNVAALDGRMIKQIRTFILRCYTCFRTTSTMTRAFCKWCGHNTLKKVAISVDGEGNQQIHINTRKPLTARGKKYSLPTIKGGKHSNNPILVMDQPMPDQKVSRIARTKTNAMGETYLTGYSPFAVRDVNSRSALLKIRGAPTTGEVRHWMRKNPNESVRRRRK